MTIEIVAIIISFIAMIMSLLNYILYRKTVKYIEEQNTPILIATQQEWTFISHGPFGRDVDFTSYIKNIGKCPAENIKIYTFLAKVEYNNEDISFKCPPYNLSEAQFLYPDPAEPLKMNIQFPFKHTTKSPKFLGLIIIIYHCCPKQFKLRS
jgi:hypothetical protein